MAYTTERKTKIYELLSTGRDRAFTIDEICAAVLDGDGGRSTVYRIISDMVKCGKVKKLTDEHTRHTTYQFLGGECHEHLHLKCKKCGKMMHLDHGTSHMLEEKILGSVGFALDEGAILFGRCEGCSEEGGK